jgi:hypothetical protein
MAVGKGSGTTFTFAGFTYGVTRISLDGATVADIGTGDLAATIRTYEPGNLVDWGTITMDFEFDTVVTLPPAGTEDTVSFDVRGEGGASIHAATAFIESISFDIPNDDVMTGTCVFRLTAALS